MPTECVDFGGMLMDLRGVIGGFDFSSEKAGIDIWSYCCYYYDFRLG
jgi:hypothetical protein